MENNKRNIKRRKKEKEKEVIWEKSLYVKLEKRREERKKPNSVNSKDHREVRGDFDYLICLIDFGINIID